MFLAIDHTCLDIPARIRGSEVHHRVRKSVVFRNHVSGHFRYPSHAIQEVC